MQFTPLEAYEQRLAKGQLQPDPAQAELISVLDYFYHQIQETAAPQSSWRAWFGGGKADSLTRPKGGAHRRGERNGGGISTSQENIYIHGEVGRGKSMAMDLLVECLPDDFPVRRIHYHAFMAEVHAQLHQIRQQNAGIADALNPVASHYASELRLLCLDEFQVQDIADAMILSRLFTLMLDAGLSVVTTSNRKPDHLYLHGLQRDSFLPFIALVKKRFRVMELLSPTDYRMQKLRGNPTYFMPETNIATLEKIFDSLCTQPSVPTTLLVSGREVVLPHTANGVAWCSFDALCRQPLGAADYEALASEFHTVFLVGIPKMTREDRNEAKRFVTLIDTLYEHKTRLLCAAAALPDDLYPTGDGSFEFHRTASRLHEMQSGEYMENSNHI